MAPKVKAAKKQLNKSTKPLPSEAIHLDPTAELTVGEQLRVQLHSNKLTVMDLFKEWDTDKSASVSRDEFHVGITALGFVAPAPAIDAVFDSFDEDHSGVLDFAELKHALNRSPADVERELRQKNKEMKAKVKNAKTKTDNKGQEIKHTENVAGYAAKENVGERLSVMAADASLLLDVMRATLSADLHVVEEALAEEANEARRANEATAAAQAAAAAAEAAAEALRAKKRSKKEKVASAAAPAALAPSHSAQAELQAQAAFWVAKLDDERAQIDFARGWEAQVHAAETRQRAAEEELEELEAHLASKEAELAAALKAIAAHGAAPTTGSGAPARAAPAPAPAPAPVPTPAPALALPSGEIAAARADMERKVREAEAKVAESQRLAAEEVGAMQCRCDEMQRRLDAAEAEMRRMSAELAAAGEGAAAQPSSPPRRPSVKWRSAEAATGHSSPPVTRSPPKTKGGRKMGLKTRRRVDGEEASLVERLLLAGALAPVERW